ncbi:hypothetical protein I6A84_14180, partial [Frankia sp. CNm7]|nr:hypothetical protein [Frankia nepalensis]
LVERPALVLGGQHRVDHVTARRAAPPRRGQGGGAGRPAGRAGPAG